MPIEIEEKNNVLGVNFIDMQAQIYVVSFFSFHFSPAYRKNEKKKHQRRKKVNRLCETDEKENLQTICSSSAEYFL